MFAVIGSVSIGCSSVGGILMEEKVLTVAPRPWIDVLGTTVSIACAIQCSIFPLLVSVLPLLGLGFLLGESVEKFFLATSSVLAVSSFIWGFRYHRRFYVFLFLVSAAALIVAGRLWVDARYEIPFVMAGSLILTAGHFLNRRLCRLCTECSENRQMREHASAHVQSKGQKEKRNEI